MADGRLQLLERITEVLRDVPEARAAWLGGSDAFDRADAWSDLDITVVSADPGAIFAAVEAALAPLEQILRMPQHFEGITQRFYRNADTGLHWMIDLCVLAAEHRHPWLEPTRHGRLIPLFDHDDVLAPTEPDDALRAQLARRLQGSVDRFRMFARTMVERNVARGKRVETLAVWHAHVLRPLVEVLRARYTPLRQDYGLRYLDDDLPADVYAEVVALTEVADLHAVAEALPRALALFDDTIAALQAEDG